MRTAPILALSAALLLSGCAAPMAGNGIDDTQAAAENADQLGTRILDQGAAERLRGAQSMSLQWISWNWRGRIEVLQTGDLITIKGGQDSTQAPKNAGDLGTGKVTIDGIVTEIGTDYFLFDGDIVITDSPDIGRVCERSGPMEFRVTQNRLYWRLQQMEQCDGLTDYVDIYF